MKKYGCKIMCIWPFAREALNAVEGEIDGIVYKLVSADFLKFNPSGF
jgi:predicted phosphohydrolase